MSTSGNKQDDTAAPKPVVGPGFIRHVLADGLEVWEGRLPDALIWSDEEFLQVWSLHPESFHTVKIFGKATFTRRWQQAYGANYRYTGSVNNALPIPRVLAPLLQWSQQSVAAELNGLLLNWYQGPDHYIGPHRDKTSDLVPGLPIVTLSFGEPRTFRLQAAGDGNRCVVEFQTGHGTALIVPWDTNRGWKHSVPAEPKKYRGQRISVTVRAFQRGVLAPDRYFE